MQADGSAARRKLMLLLFSLTPLLLRQMLQTFSLTLNLIKPLTEFKSLHFGNKILNFGSINLRLNSLIHIL